MDVSQWVVWENLPRYGKNSELFVQLNHCSWIAGWSSYPSVTRSQSKLQDSQTFRVKTWTDRLRAETQLFHIPSISSTFQTSAAFCDHIQRPNSQRQNLMPYKLSSMATSSQLQESPYLHQLEALDSNHEYTNIPIAWNVSKEQW